MEFEGILIVHHLADSHVMRIPSPEGFASGRLAGTNFNPGTAWDMKAVPLTHWKPYLSSTLLVLQLAPSS